MFLKNPKGLLLCYEPLGVLVDEHWFNFLIVEILLNISASYLIFLFKVVPSFMEEVPVF